MVISVMKQHGFHEPVDIHAQPHELVRRYQDLGKDPYEYLAKKHGEEIKPGDLISLKAEIEVAEMHHKGVRWRDLDLKDIKRMRLRAVAAEENVAIWRAKAAELSEKLKVIASGSSEAIVSVFAEEREALLKEIEQLTDDEHRKSAELAALEVERRSNTPRIDHLESELKSSQEEVDRLREEVSKRIAELESVWSDLSQSRHAVAQLSGELVKLRANKRPLTESPESLLQAMEHVAAANSALIQFLRGR